MSRRVAYGCALGPRVPFRHRRAHGIRRPPARKTGVERHHCRDEKPKSPKKDDWEALRCYGALGCFSISAIRDLCNVVLLTEFSNIWCHSSSTSKLFFVSCAQQRLTEEVSGQKHDLIWARFILIFILPSSIFFGLPSPTHTIHAIRVGMFSVPQMSNQFFSVRVGPGYFLGTKKRCHKGVYRVTSDSVGLLCMPWIAPEIRKRLR